MANAQQAINHIAGASIEQEPMACIDGSHGACTRNSIARNGILACAVSGIAACLDLGISSCSVISLYASAITFLVAQSAHQLVHHMPKILSEYPQSTKTWLDLKHDLSGSAEGHGVLTTPYSVQASIRDHSRFGADT